MPTSNKLATLPLMSTFPVVGLVILLNIFNKVDLPAPLLPIIPNLSPLFKVNDTSFTAQYSSDSFLLKIILMRDLETSLFDKGS